MENVRPRVRVPAKASAGDTITLKTLIQHPMESGQRKDSDGNVIPMHIIETFTATFNGETVIEVEMHPSISTNPYFEFEALVPESGEFVFTWNDQDGDVYEEKASIEVA